MSSRRVDVADLIDGVRACSRAHVARAITLVESTRPEHRQAARELLVALDGVTSMTTRVGITGTPGAGKSTFIEAMGCRLIEQGHRVAVLAVDPSSSLSGGSVLGDRTRMGALSSSQDAFIRPSPSGAHLGGVARATREATIVVEAAGYDVVIIETVGVGQSEVAVSQMVDTMMMLALTGAGDQLQGIKRGILEVVDVIAVNKADGENLPAARVTAREYRAAMRLMQSSDYIVPVLTCSALAHTGLDEVWHAVLDHRAYLEKTGGLERHRAEQRADWVKSQVEMTLVDSIYATPRVHAIVTEQLRSVREDNSPVFDAVTAILRAYAAEIPTMSWGR